MIEAFFFHWHIENCRIILNNEKPKTNVFPILSKSNDSLESQPWANLFEFHFYLYIKGLWMILWIHTFLVSRKRECYCISRKWGPLEEIEEYSHLFICSQNALQLLQLKLESRFDTSFWFLHFAWNLNNPFSPGTKWTVHVFHLKSRWL